MNKETISTHADAIILNKDFRVFIGEGRVKDLQRMYALLKRVEYQTQIKAQWVLHLKARGEELLSPELIAKR